MAEGSGKQPRRSRRRRVAPSRVTDRRDRSDRPLGFRARLQRDPILFWMTIALLAFTTWSLAVSWKLFGDPVLLVLTIGSLVPAFYLFYLRDRRTT